jgi:MFS family permease
MDADTKMLLALGFVGMGAVAAGMLGIVLPAGERLAAGLALVVGAGIGVIALAIGTQVANDVNDSPDGYANVFLVAAALGLLGTLVSLALLWRRTAAERTAAERAAPPASAPSEG